MGKLIEQLESLLAAIESLSVSSDGTALCAQGQESKVCMFLQCQCYLTRDLSIYIQDQF